MGELTRTTGSVQPSLSGEIFEMIRRWSKGGTTVQRPSTFLSSITGGIGLEVPDTGVDPSLAFDDSEVPQPVAAASASGNDETPSRRDHEHRGVSSFGAVGQPAIYGDARVEAGVGITLDQTGNVVRITNSGAGSGNEATTFLYHEYRNGSEAIGQTFNLAFAPVGDVAAYLAGFRKTKETHFSQAAQAITFSNDVTIVANDQVIFTYFYNPAGGGVFNPGIAGVSGRMVEYYALLSSSLLTFQTIYMPVGDVQVYFSGFRRFKGLHYTQSNDLIEFDGVEIDFVDGDLIVFDYLYSQYGGS